MVSAMRLTYEFRLLPSKAQHRILSSLLESQRLLYNAALEERIGAYRHGIVRSYFDQTKAVTEWRQSDSEAASVNVHIQHWTLMRVDQAFIGFYKRVKKDKKKAGFPRFRSASRWRTFGINSCAFQLCGGRMRFKGMVGGLKIHLHRPPPTGKPRSCTLTRDTKGWKVGLAFDLAEGSPKGAQRCVGVDLGIATFAALSDGGVIPSVKAARRAESRLRTLHRALQRKDKLSKSRRKARVELARAYAKTARIRSDHLHQATSRLVRDYDLIAVERLSVASLSRGFLAKQILDASWGKFLSMLRYKAERAGARVVEVDRANTTQDCSACGVSTWKSLDDRKHVCTSCGVSMDRDLNAARNILCRAGVGPGLRNVVGLSDKRAGGNLEGLRDDVMSRKRESLP
jgi:putative transposase